ncbi:MAG: DUF262 domain-containing protein [Myxococcota bacterium]
MTAAKSKSFASLSLDEQIDRRRSDMRADKLDMTYGDFANMYEGKELVIAPAYQRLFRWKPGQKTRFIESILLGIPTPAIFVAETEEGVWELVDGLQRLSTVLEFMGVLLDADGNKVAPSVLSGTEGAELPALEEKSFEDLSLRSRLSLRRAACRVEAVKVGSGKRMKYDLFERLNTGGARLTDQEIRNCIFRAEAPDLMNYFDKLSLYDPFQANLGLSELQMKSLYDRGLVLRFFALKNDIESFRHDVEPFVTEYIHKIVASPDLFNQDEEAELFKRTVSLITDVLKDEAWRHLKDGKAQGAFSVYLFETLTLVLAEDLDAFEAMDAEELATRLNKVKVDERFRAAGGSGGNTKPRLQQRLSAAREILGRSN